MAPVGATSNRLSQRKARSGSWRRRTSLSTGRCVAFVVVVIVVVADAAAAAIVVVIVVVFTFVVIVTAYSCYSSYEC